MFMYSSVSSSELSVEVTPLIHDWTMLTTLSVLASRRSSPLSKRILEVADWIITNIAMMTTAIIGIRAISSFP